MAKHKTASTKKTASPMGIMIIEQVGQLEMDLAEVLTRLDNLEIDLADATRRLDKLELEHER